MRLLLIIGTLRHSSWGGLAKRDESMIKSSRGIHRMYLVMCGKRADVCSVDVGYGFVSHSRCLSGYAKNANSTYIYFVKAVLQVWFETGKLGSEQACSDPESNGVYFAGNCGTVILT